MHIKVSGDSYFSFQGRILVPIFICSCWESKLISINEKLSLKENDTTVGHLDFLVPGKCNE